MLTSSRDTLPSCGTRYSRSGSYSKIKYKQTSCQLGQCHEIFCFRFFSWIIFPQAPEMDVRVISKFFANLQRYLQVKVRYQQHRWQIWHRRKEKFIYILTLLPKGVQKNNKKFSDWRFFPFATGVILRIYPRIYEKVRNSLTGILRDMGEIDSWQNLKSEMSWHCPFTSFQLQFKQPTGAESAFK